MARILALGAHPDDLEFGMGGSLIKFADKGFEVVMVVLTKGEMGTKGTANIRTKEMRDSAKLIGAKLEILDFKDCQIEDNYESRLKIADVIRKYRPDTVFAPYHTNEFSHKDSLAHPDHAATGNLVRHALRFAKFRKIELEHPQHTVGTLIYYMVPRQKVPTLINDVSAYHKKWVEAVKCHKSQLTPELLEGLIMSRRFYGNMIGVEYGEQFIVDEPIQMNMEMFKV